MLEDQIAWHMVRYNNEDRRMPANRRRASRWPPVEVDGQMDE